jgi:starch phosphorylase
MADSSRTPIEADRAHIDEGTYSLLPMDIEGVGSLAELALDLRWSWNHAADELWQQLEPRLWGLTQNAWVVLQTVSRDRLKSILNIPTFRRRLDLLLQERRNASVQPAWFQQRFPQSPLSCVAYFSMEFMLSEALPIYSGGLGNVAGDQLKAASDLGVPVIGIGILFQQGYFRQVIGRDGRQQALFPFNDPVQLPIVPLRDRDGDWLRIEIALPGYSVWLRCWQVQVGRNRLYLLDSNDAANFPAHRGITSELYPSAHELRIKQELVLGIGGWRLLRALGVTPEVCHLNEGHAAFAVLERARGLMEDTGLPFEVALTATRAGNLFTTHTAVEAGFDVYHPSLIEQYLRSYALEDLGISIEELLALGRRHGRDAFEPFNMAYLAVRGSGTINGVSRLHGKVSRNLFADLFPSWPLEEIPIGHVTNGIHTPSWDSAQADEVWTATCGKGRWVGSLDSVDACFRRVPDARLWQLRTEARRALVRFVRERMSVQWAAAGEQRKALGTRESLFDPAVLTMGFARRFATYKRPNLLLHDPDRLLRILNDPRRPVQLIVAGKAHPDDIEGQRLIEEWIHFIARCQGRVVFLSDYDMLLTEQLVQGVDLWLNTPRRPWEASGTSGMKVLVNGGLNISELDGWWAEAYAPEVGWALGDGQEHGADLGWDAAEADELYRLLEREIVPEFYARDAHGVPTAWVSKMRESMARLALQYSANRVVRQYTEEIYLPAAAAYQARVSDGAAKSREAVSWQHELGEKWPALHFGRALVSREGDWHILEVEVFQEGIEPDALVVEIYANPIELGRGTFRQPMTRVRSLPAPGGHLYSAKVPTNRPANDYTPRAFPKHEGLSIPLEASWITWQR